MSKVHIYIRWSSKAQESGSTKERQLDVCEAYAVAKGWTIADRFGDYGRSAWSGDHLKVGELGKFADRVRSGEIPANDILLVENSDRLSRQDIWTAVTWLREMTGLGLNIAIVAGDKFYTPESFVDQAALIESMRALMEADTANKYSALISSRVKHSWVTRRKEAAERVVISAHVPGWLSVIGERKDPSRKFEALPERVAVVNEIYRMAADGMGARSIARTLNERGIEPWGREYHHKLSKGQACWENTYVSDILASLAVEGDYQPTLGRRRQREAVGERIIGYFPRVVDADLVERARAAVGARKGRGGGGIAQIRMANLFAGLVVCAQCGGSMILQGNATKPFRYFYCKTAQRGGACTQKSGFTYKPFEEAALDAMLPLALDDQFFQKPDDSQRLAVELAETKKAIDLKKERATRLARFIAGQDDAPEAEAEYREIRASIRQSETRRDELDRALIAARGSVTPTAHARRVMLVRSALEHEDHETRVAARRKVVEAIRGVVSTVICDAADTYRSKLQKPHGGPHKTLTLVMVGGVHSIKFNNDGIAIGEVSLGDQVAAGDGQLRQGLTGNAPTLERQMKDYLRRAAR